MELPRICQAGTPTDLDPVFQLLTGTGIWRGCSCAGVPSECGIRLLICKISNQDEVWILTAGVNYIDLKINKG